ncbi:MAG TPA: DUF5684 domain-containing protein [Verrucomicrobiae bacterium]|nr:DUF5684 domain-containing protein [Verrucomicrobiae bacterium]
MSVSETVILSLILAILLIAVAVVWTGYRFFQKTGKPGWTIFVPFYAGWTLAKVGGKPAWWGLLIGFSVSIRGTTISTTVLAILGAIWLIWFTFWLLISLGVARNFGRSTAFGFLLGLLPFIGYPILAFGSAQYSFKKQKERWYIIVLVLTIVGALYGGSLVAGYILREHIKPATVPVESTNVTRQNTSLPNTSSVAGDTPQFSAEDVNRATNIASEYLAALQRGDSQTAYGLAIPPFQEADSAAEMLSTFQGFHLSGYTRALSATGSGISAYGHPYISLVYVYTQSGNSQPFYIAILVQDYISDEGTGSSQNTITNDWGVTSLKGSTVPIVAD